MDAPADAAESAAATPPPTSRRACASTSPRRCSGCPTPSPTRTAACSLDVPVADSITTWRITALASSQDGRLGSVRRARCASSRISSSTSTCPLSLTVGDEVAVPVGVFNYLPEAQTVRLELAAGGLVRAARTSRSQKLQIGANEIQRGLLPHRAPRQFGLQPFQVTAWGSQMSDAIRKEVRVYPDGKQIQLHRLRPPDPGRAGQRDRSSSRAEAIPGTQTLTVKIYPGVLSQVVEGLDSILRMPNGCFEQTSSTTYPNVLVLDYLNTTNQAAPEAQMKAEEYINLGYQRLTTFEVQSSGGFSLFGDAPADRMLTAYGLQEFSDMSRVHDVDPALMRPRRRLADGAAGRRRLVGERPRPGARKHLVLAGQRPPAGHRLHRLEPGRRRLWRRSRHPEGRWTTCASSRPRPKTPTCWRWSPTRWWPPTWPRAARLSSATQAVLDRLAGMAVQRRQRRLLAQRRGHLHGQRGPDRQHRDHRPGGLAPSCAPASTPTWPTPPWPTWCGRRTASAPGTAPRPPCWRSRRCSRACAPAARRSTPR